MSRTPVKRETEYIKTTIPADVTTTPTKSTHDVGERHYDTLDKLCSDYILNGPGGYDTKDEEENVLKSIKLYRGVFDFSEKIVDRLVCRLRIFDLMCTTTLSDLHSYTDNDWIKLMKVLSSLRHTLRSPSAQKTHTPIFCGFDTSRHHNVRDTEIPLDSTEKEMPSPGGAGVKECFEGPFLRLYEECNVQSVLSTIRKKLDMANQVADGSTLPLVLSAQHLKTFIDAVDKHFHTNQRLHGFFISMLKFDGETVVGLLPASELKAKVEKHQLKTFHSSLILLLQHWSTTLENSSSTIKYQSGTGGKKRDDVDEIEDIVVLGSPVNIDIMMDDDDKDLPITLSSPPTSARKPEAVKTTPVPSKNKNVVKANGTPGNEKKKRMRFTEDEKNSIKMGLEIHGKGNWAAIKKEFPDALINRTSVQIKDCYRTMVKLGEIIEQPQDRDGVTEGENQGTQVEAKTDDGLAMNDAIAEGENDEEHEG